MKLHKIAANETELMINHTVILFSYDTPVAYFRQGSGYFRTEKYYSKTTTTHINKWLAGAKAQTIPQGEIETLLA